MTPMEFRIIRHRLGMTQKTLGAAIGYATKTIAEYESGRRRIPRRVLLALDRLDRVLSPSKEKGEAK